MIMRENVLSASGSNSIVVGRVVEGCVGEDDDRYLEGSDVQYPTSRVLLLLGNVAEGGRVLSRRSSATKGVDLAAVEPEKLLQFLMAEKGTLKAREEAFLAQTDADEEAYWKAESDAGEAAGVEIAALEVVPEVVPEAEVEGGVRMDGRALLEWIRVHSSNR